MQTVQHPDGIWQTSEHQYKDRKILIKSKQGYGMKAHVFKKDSDKVDFTLRYSYIKPVELLEKAHNKIDKPKHR